MDCVSHFCLHSQILESRCCRSYNHLLERTGDSVGWNALQSYNSQEAFSKFSGLLDAQSQDLDAFVRVGDVLSLSLNR